MSNWGTTYPKGTVVSLEAHGENFIRWVPDPIGFGHKIPIQMPISTVFDGWSGQIPRSSSLILKKNNPIVVTMDADKSIMAHFSIWQLRVKERF
jgi:hypothetical protein